MPMLKNFLKDLLGSLLPYTWEIVYIILICFAGFFWSQFFIAWVLEQPWINLVLWGGLGLIDLIVMALVFAQFIHDET